LVTGMIFTSVKIAVRSASSRVRSRMDYSCPIMPDYPLWRNRPDADARIDDLNPDSNGVFIANRNGPSELLLRSNATRAEVLHELSHFRHMKRVEFDDYIEAGRLGREQTVYNTIKTNRYWSQMTQAERDAAFIYILGLGGNPFGGGRP
jgi:hypothetical protein